MEQLVVCDIFLHWAELLPVHPNAFPSMGNRGTSTTFPPARPSMHVALQFTGISSPLPSIIIPIDNETTLQEDIALRLQNKPITLRLDKGKSVCFASAGLKPLKPAQTVNSSNNLETNNDETFINLMLLTSSMPGDSVSNMTDADFVGSGTISLSSLVRTAVGHQLTAPVDAAVTPPSSSSSSPSSSIAQFHVTILSLANTPVANILVSCRVNAVPESLRPFMVQQALLAATTFTPSPPAGSSPPSTTISSSSVSSLRPPMRVGGHFSDENRTNPGTFAEATKTLHYHGSTVTRSGENNNTEEEEDLMRRESTNKKTTKAIARGTVELQSSNVTCPPPIWFGNVRIRVPTTARAEPAASVSTASPSTGPAPSSSSSSLAMQQQHQIHPLKIGFTQSQQQLQQQHQFQNMDISSPEDNQDIRNRDPYYQSQEQNVVGISTLDGLLADLIRWRDMQQQQHTVEPHTGNEHIKKGNGGGNVSSSMAALQKALISSGMEDTLSLRIVQTLGLAHDHDSTSMKYQETSHNLFGGDERTKVLAAALPRTFRVLKGEDVAQHDMQVAIDAIYSFHSEPQMFHAMKGTVQRKLYGGAGGNDGSSSSSPFAGSPRGANSAVRGSPLGAKFRDIALSAAAAAGLSKSPYAKSLSAMAGKPPTAPSTSASQQQQQAGLDTTSWSSYRVPDTPGFGVNHQSADSFHASGGGLSSSNANTPTNPIRGVRLNTAMRARLAALEDEKREQRLQAYHEKEAQEAAAAAGPLWVLRNANQLNNSRNRRGSKSSFGSNGGGGGGEEEERHATTTTPHYYHRHDENMNNATANTRNIDTSFGSTSSAMSSGSQRHTHSTSNASLTANAVQVANDARRSAGYRASVKPQDVPSLRTSPHKSALQMMPSARSTASGASSSNAGGRHNLSQNRQTTNGGGSSSSNNSLANDDETILPAKDAAARQSVELPSTSVLLQDATQRSGPENKLHITTFTSSSSVNHKDAHSSAIISPTTTTAAAAAATSSAAVDESVLQLSVSGGSPQTSTFSRNQHTAANNNVSRHQSNVAATTDTSVISTVHSSSTTTGGSSTGNNNNNNNATGIDEEDGDGSSGSLIISAGNFDLNATGMSGAHLSHLGLGGVEGGPSSASSISAYPTSSRKGESYQSGSRNSGRQSFTSPLSDQYHDEDEEDDSEENGDNSGGNRVRTSRQYHPRRNTNEFADGDDDEDEEHDDSVEIADPSAAMRARVALVAKKKNSSSSSATGESVTDTSNDGADSFGSLSSESESQHYSRGGSVHNSARSAHGVITEEEDENDEGDGEDDSGGSIDARVNAALKKKASYSTTSSTGFSRGSSFTGGAVARTALAANDDEDGGHSSVKNSGNASNGNEEEVDGQTSMFAAAAAALYRQAALLNDGLAKGEMMGGGGGGHYGDDSDDELETF